MGLGSLSSVLSPTEREDAEVIVMSPRTLNASTLKGILTGYIVRFRLVMGYETFHLH